MLVTGSETSQAPHGHENNVAISSSLREAIPIFGFLVGVCWEKAFSEANLLCSECFYEIIDHENFRKLVTTHWLMGELIEFLALHPMLARVVCGSLIALAVTIAWWKYLVPYARIDDLQHLYLLITQLTACDHVDKSINPNHVTAVCQLCKATDDNRNCKKEGFRFI